MTDKKFDKRKQYLIAAGLVPLVAALSEPPNLTPLIFTVFVFIDVFADKFPHKTDHQNKLKVALHFTLLYILCQFTVLLLGLVTSKLGGQMLEFKPQYTMFYPLSAAFLLALLSRFKINLLQIFLLQTIFDPFLLVHSSYLHNWLDMASRDWPEAIAFFICHVAQAGSAAAICMVILKEDLKSWYRGKIS
ncbi:MAG: hypothetical protein IPP57_21940 [Candidatus Obscuribacter sp.]|nr:hypothetical protein [Candidatus Obscuribacter sp.]MBK9620359.1 hypothetical protein [Candidatus Obscuribacter sp.]MBK9773439.1 hypothetical protein [Candidatus Obscuribacter sp.]MBL0187761.1 hypothetical protein [Candidatus Obscuribacter sp.]MBP6348552.1 hypothetical protein [Candidatus Obscuribacter sp.]